MKKRIIVFCLVIATFFLIGIVVFGVLLLWRKNTAVCTLQRVPGLVLSVVDEKGVIIDDAQISTTPSLNDFYYSSIDGTYSGLYEKSGVYEYIIKKDGFRDFSDEVRINKDECHVDTEKRKVILEKN